MVIPRQINYFYEFGPFRLNRDERILLREGEVVPATPKQFDLLLVLIENRGHVVDKERLIQEVWPDIAVEEGNLTTNIYMLRKVLGEGTNEQQYIQTLPRRGYRFVGEVREVAAGDARPAVEELVEIRLLTRQEQESQLPRKALTRGGWASIVAKWKLALAAFGLFVVTAAVAFYWTWSKPKPPASGEAVKTLAVLPFKPLLADSRNESLELGMADTLISKLGGIRQLSLRPLSSVRKYTSLEQDPIEAARELGVDYVLEGNLQMEGDNTRATVRLWSVKDGRAVWSDQCDEQCSTIFELQDAIASRIASALGIELTGDEQKRLAKRYTDNAEAYQLYLKGRYFWNKRTEDGFNRGIVQFKQSVERDSNYALAYAGLADSYIGLTFYGFDAPHETMPKAKEAAMNALAIDNTLAEAHASLAHILMNYDWNWPEAEREFKLSMELNPDYATAHQWYAIHYLTAAGRLEEALQEVTRALELEPTSLVMNAFMGGTLYFAGRYDEAIEQCHRTIEMDPNFAVAHWYLGLAYEQKRMLDDAISEFRKAIALSEGCPLMQAALGHAYAASNNRVEAARILAELNALSKHRYVSSYEVAAIYIALGENERAFQLLERAYKEHCFHLVYLTVWPQFGAVSSDLRFQTIVQRIGLAG